MNRKERRASKAAQPAGPSPASVREIFAGAVQFHHAGRLAEAEQLYRRVLSAEPRHADSLHRLGVIAYQAGQYDAAVELIGKALAQNASAAPYHGHLGLVLGALGRWDEAIAASRAALRLDPGQPDGLNNLGVLLMQTGELAEAAACLRKALALAPDLPNAHGNLGAVLRAMGKPVEATQYLRRALEMGPDQPDVLNHLALALLAQGERRGALESVLRALALMETAQSKRIFVACVKDGRFEGVAESLRPFLLRALQENWDRPGDLARVCANIIKHNPDLAGDALLQALLRLTPNLDMDLERRLTRARRDFLQDVLGGREGDLDFASALAQQCFINEYVFSQDEDEGAQAAELRDRLAAALQADAPIPAGWPLAVAAYFPLLPLPSSGRLLERPWPPAVEDVLTQQIREPEEERRARDAIVRLTEIADAGSRLVRAQYEDNPYPRWVRCGTAEPEDLLLHLRQTFPFASVKPIGVDDGIDMLIAGCGTGRNAIETAQKFQGARILAVDLSRYSLGHAARKSREMGLEIEYAQADLLEMGSLDRRFDMIEAVGVLHHLADPFAGWRVLLSLLRPCGVMRLGFYSQVARRNLPRAQGSTTDDIRKARQHLAEHSDQRDMLLHTADFFTTSTCRDLLFHVQEHHLTLDGIGRFLREHDLTLLGFAIDDDVLAAYRARFPDDPGATNLDHWQAFEQDHSDTFAGMYQFWLQKPA